jgi:hypothetical protein
MTDKFYGDAVERFTAMANADHDTEVDRAHFRMWCRIAAEEIASERAKVAKLEAKVAALKAKS